MRFLLTVRFAAFICREDRIRKGIEQDKFVRLDAVDLKQFFQKFLF